ncbi:hypothetical protein UFOVP261_11 [uncultured Caudovirales phage]|uniref:Uncharacterized protein n=1 Tax=uncultured Caudovirales phage TaxID=2100421 RepID=A0A6J5LCM7_9CAUD|nr:hypothetical protein UFOVP261_11 [uncultured Caudovirales phage]
MTSHSLDQLGNFHTLLKSNGVWILFEKTPTLLDIAQARNLLGELTDQIIKDQLNVSIPIE